MNRICLPILNIGIKGINIPYGPELATGWNTSAWWNTVGSGWTFDEGVSASCNGSSAQLVKYNIWVYGKTYRVVITTVRNSGTLYPPYDGSGPPPGITISTTTIYDYTPDPASPHMTIASVLYNGDITALSIKEAL